MTTPLTDEIDRLREALRMSKATLEMISKKAHEVGLEGTKDWDRVVGTADLYGCIMLIDATLGKAK